jgi:hypothetical protein
MASTLENLAHDPDLRESLEREGRRILTMRHDPAKIGARWLALYRDASSGLAAASWEDCY